jgi:hypothetical protein
MPINFNYGLHLQMIKILVILGAIVIGGPKDAKQFYRYKAAELDQCF